MNEVTVNNANKVNKEGLFSGFGSSMGVSAVMTGGFGSLSAVKRYKGVKNAIAKTKLSNDVINEFLKNSNSNADSFTKAYAAAKNYETYNSAIKASQKAAKALNKVKNGKVSILQRIMNIGKSPEEIIAKIEEKSKKANKVVDEFTTKLKSGEEIAGNKVLSQSLGKNVKGIFKEELLNPINLLYAGVSTFSRIKEEAIPVFKEKGFVEGIKQTGITIAKSAADIFSNAGFSAVFRTIGSRVGIIAGPVGAAVGGLVGDIFGTFLSNKFITKIFGENKPKEENNEETQEVAISEQNEIPQDYEYATDTENIKNAEYAKYTGNSSENPNSTKKLSHLKGQALIDYANQVQAEANKRKRTRKEFRA